MTYKYALLALAMMSAPALADTVYQALESREPRIVEGVGGTLVEKNGIDYWTTGDPPRRYQILGVINDARDNRIWSGDAIGSKKVAKLAKAAGGDAVVLQGRGSEVVGRAVFSNANANGYAGINVAAQARDIVVTDSAFLVVKYLD